MPHKFTSKLQGARVLVIGGTGGIGYVVAEGAVEFGAIVTVASSNPERLSEAVQRLKSSYPEAVDRVFGETCDIGDCPTIEANLLALLKAVTADETHKLDHIVVTAAPKFDGLTLQDATFENLKFDRYVTGIMLGKVAPAYMNAKQSSSITFTGGAAYLKPPPYFATVISMAGALETLSRALAISLAPIRVNMVSPGLVKVEGGRGKQLDEMAAKISLFKKPGTGEDCAEAYLYFMKDAYITGTVMHNNGGFSLT